MLNLVTENIKMTDQEFRLISKTVYDHCGINLHENKRELVRSRLAKQIRLRGMKSYSQYFEHAMADKSGVEFSKLIDSLSTNLTSFFREADHFEYLGNELIPSLAAKCRETGVLRIRGWSAGCSSGEEPYTIALTLSEALAGRTRTDVKILASDISTTVLEKAKNGTYHAERVASVSPMLRNKYFKTIKKDGHKFFEANHQLKSKIIFKYLNLMEPWPITTGLDFIFCRNVMIYFDKPTQQKLISRYWDVLKPGGILFIGHSESFSGIKHKFSYVRPTVYRKP